MVSKGTAKPYVKCIGASASGVTQSAYLVRFKKYVMLLDFGGYQESDIATNYKRNIELLKKIKPREIDYVIISHEHIDHTMLVPALFARGCQAHVFVPKGSIPFLELLWEDSMKIFTADCQKLNNKGTKSSPFYTQENIERALDRCIEIEYNIKYQVNEEICLTYFPSNHIIYAAQVYLDFIDGSVHHRLGYTGDIGGVKVQPYTIPRVPMPYVNLLIGENTYNKSSRISKPYDRSLDIEKIKSVLNDEFTYRVLFPCFSLQRTQTILTLLYNLMREGEIDRNCQIYLDSPLAIKISKIWPWNTDILNWGNLHIVEEFSESQALMSSNPKGIVISASGFLNGGRILEWLKCSLGYANNYVMFCGYSGENNLASQIRYGDSTITIDDTIVYNLAHIVELVSFSSHADYQELVDYYTEDCKFDKLMLVHGDNRYKPEFSKTIQEILVSQGKSSRVICANQDTKSYF